MHERGDGIRCYIQSSVRMPEQGKAWTFPGACGEGMARDSAAAEHGTVVPHVFRCSSPAFPPFRRTMARSKSRRLAYRYQNPSTPAGSVHGCNQPLCPRLFCSGRTNQSGGQSTRAVPVPNHDRGRSPRIQLAGVVLALSLPSPQMSRPQLRIYPAVPRIHSRTGATQEAQGATLLKESGGGGRWEKEVRGHSGDGISERCSGDTGGRFWYRTSSPPCPPGRLGVAALGYSVLRVGRGVVRGVGGVATHSVVVHCW